MRRFFIPLLSLVALAWAQEPALGFPSFAPPPEAMLEPLEDRGDIVLVRHAYGETEVPKNPQRLFTDGSTLEPVLALGRTPVGTNFFLAPQDTPPALAERLEGVTLLERTLNDLEAVLALEPDLILVWELLFSASDSETLYAQLSQIAPTVVLNASPYTYWEEATRDLGELLNGDDAAVSALATFKQDAEAQCDRLRGVVGEGTLTVLSVLAREVRLMGVGLETPAGFIPAPPTRWAYGTCGLTPGPEVARLAGTELGTVISLEVLPELSADHLLVMSLTPEDETVLTEHPLWDAVPAVRAGRVYRTGVLTAVGPFTTLWALERAANAIAGETGD
jgi:iron complex transport system substrate-binding protein